MKTISRESFVKSINTQLFWLLLITVACFFTWSENVAITRLIKVVGRMGMLLLSFMIYRKIIRFGAVDQLRIGNPFPLWLYMGYLLLGLISFAWSTDPAYSALQWFMTAQTLVLSFYAIKSIHLLDTYFPGHPVRLSSLIANSSFTLVLVFVIGMWVAPDVFYRMTNGGEEARLGGYMMNPNELGMLAGIGVAGLMFDLRKKEKRAWNVFKLLVLFYGLYATGSRSSLVGALLIIGYHAMISESKKVKFWMTAGIAIVAPVGIYTVVLKGGDTERLEEVMSMTGRLPFWTALINEGLPREPWFGFGFMRIDYNDFFQSAHTYPGKMTHNTFMQVLMNLGFVGLTIALFQLVSTIKGIISDELEKKTMFICMLIPLIINSFTEFGIFGESNYGILFYQLILVSVAIRGIRRITPAESLYLSRKRPDLNPLDYASVT